MSFFCVDFEDFLRFNQLPRNPDNIHRPSSVQDKETPLQEGLHLHDISSLDSSTSVLIFVSHVWWMDQHPDNAYHDKVRLIKEGVSKVMQSLAKGLKCYLWLDYCCLNQDEIDHSTLSSLEPLMRHVDVLFTPILAKGELIENYSDYLEGYLAEGWNTGERAYLNRAWCRTEMFYASSTLKQTDPSRVSQFQAGLAAYASIGRGSKLTSHNSLNCIQ